MRSLERLWAASSQEEPTHSIDFTFDGDVNLGPTAPKRPTVIELRKRVEALLDGGDSGPVDQMLGMFFGNLEGAIRDCRKAAQQFPDREEFFTANLEGYRKAGKAIEIMDGALEDNDPDALEDGLEMFEAAALEIDQLVRTEAQEQAEN